MTKLATTEYNNRRHALLKKLPQGAVVIVQCAPVHIRNGDVEHDYRQDSSFYYLAGMVESNATLVLVNGVNGPSTTIFCASKNKLQEIWHGRRLGVDAAPDVLMIDQAYSNESLADKLIDLLDDASQVVYSFSRADTGELVQQSLSMLRRLARQGKICPTQLADLDPLVNAMRLFKSEAEVAQMTAACAISVTAHKRAMSVCKVGMHEYQLAAELHHQFTTQGSQRLAYGSIVAGGENACILHYTNNDQVLQDGDLVLIDAGCELDHYASDITRTFPVNGRFSEAQKTIYELVLAAHEAALACIKPGAVYTDMQDAAVKVITQGLIEIGLLTGELEQNIEQQTFRKFYMHNIGHWLGMDVHDVGVYKLDGASRPLIAGMVTTVEPGIYIDPEDLDIAPQWRGIGVRIEDNILVTDHGYRNLTANLPVSVADIETIMAS
ncbi:Xaa-Pro aminopeptidase [Oceanospirillaceae bacterium]|jgi:Xaa-Pro aminopeptidase|nr:Xaa-Pro aminopeptidase [Oceanospirillaceae bacterium]MBT4997185.1 Xaa-Pro aminopeptidase [Oceanospirillaceae bacterium]MBT5630032.1 Xaa-Pro aminopeptidase [Oceanospirillaceae bacterium]MBT6100568.1 Xaa-Pro aminopeptidase [Oceanospirillaceae bacterium]MDB9904380.1 Xaa-Pro aminopeptidase [Oceanospirillaceae bacterium]